MRRLAFALALFGLVAGGGRKQVSARDPQHPEPVFRTEVDRVEIDAFVMDAKGEFLRGLTRDDFEVFEEGVRQEITAFAEIEVPIDRPGETPPGGVVLPRDTATNEEAFGGRVYVFLLDAAHTDPRRSGRVRELASRFIEEQMEADDIGAVVVSGGAAGAGQTFTSDKRLLLGAVGRFTGGKPASATVERLDLIEFQRDTVASRGREPSDALAPVRGRDLDPSDLERASNARQSMETLQNVARGLGAARGRRKSILYFAEGLDYDTLDVMRRVQRDAPAVLHGVREATAAAARYGVTVFPVDPRGLISGLGSEDIEMTAPVGLTGSQLGPEDLQITASASRAGISIDSQSLDREVQRSLDSLRTLATQTGGFAVVDTNDYGPAYDSIVRANSQYYLMGYHPGDFRRDGEFRRIEVRVKRPGVTVVARDGYVRPKGDEEEAPGPGTRAAADTSPEVRELLDRPWAQTGLTLGVTAAAFRGTAGSASVAATIHVSGRGLPFRQDGDRAVNEIEVSLLAIDQEGRVRDGGRMLARPRLLAPTRERVLSLGLRFVRRLDLPPGRYQLRVAAREAEQGKRGSVFYDLEVPGFGGEELAMSGVLVTSKSAPRTLTASTDDQVERLLETPPTVTRTFATDDVLSTYTEVYPGRKTPRDLTLTARLTSAEGLVVFRATEERGPSDLGADGRLSHQVAVPLADLRPGRYVLEIEARPPGGEEAATRALAFDVVPAEGLRASGEAPPGALSGPGGSRAASRIDRLEAWLAAVEQHEPGTDDGAARMVRSWAPEELAELATDLSLVARLIEQPKHPVLWLTDPERPTRFFRAPYSTDDERRLRAAARAAALACDQGKGPAPDEAGPDDAKPGEAAVRCARNRILKRGAVLHTDAAIRIEDRTAPPPGREGRPERRQVRFVDGQQRAAEGAPGHWELARSLLENVAPDPEEDETVRLWYIATSAYGQYHQRHTRHEEQAVDLFPEDAHLLFLAGCLHETFASPTIQSLARSIRVPGARHGLDSEKPELRTAAELFRRALETDPSLVEPRIRLGRVLHLLGEPRPAELELRQAVTTLLSEGGSAVDPDARLLLYFAEMFYGAAAEELGQLDRARASYVRAAELYPGAPSPLLALSQLALRDDDRAAALDAVRGALLPQGGGRGRDDPWWSYHAIQGRDAAAWFDRLYRSLADGS
jgi:VWFA-related protein